MNAAAERMTLKEEAVAKNDLAVYENEIDQKKIVSRNVVATEDYLNDPEKYKRDIIAYGLSVLPSRDECKKAYKKFPYVRKYRSIAEGKTNEERGSWKTTPGKISPEHITWWVCKDINPCAFFEFDSKNGDEDE